MRDLTNVAELFGRALRVNDCVVVVPVYGSGPTWADCVDSLLEHTSPQTPIVLFDDAGSEAKMLAAVRDAEQRRPGRELFRVRQPQNLGFVENVNLAFEMLNPADVIVLNSDTIVGPAWDAMLIAAGRSMTTVATATALTNNGTIYSVPSLSDWDTIVPTRTEVTRAAIQVAARSRRLRPHMPTATSFCTFYSRRALNVVGHFDPVFSPGYGEEVDFCLRATNLGFVHVAADDVLVYHAGGESFGDTELNESKWANDQLVTERHAHWARHVDEFVDAFDSPRERSLHLAGCAVRGLTVLIDAENIHPELTGTYEGSVRLVRALDAHDDVRRIVWTASAGRQSDIESVCTALTLSKSVFVASEHLDSLPFIDVAFRPYQDFSGQHWPELASRAHRNIIWILDLIATHVAEYSASYEAYTRLRDSMEASVQRADAVAVLTPHVQRDLESFTRYRVADKVFELPNGKPDISPALLAASQNDVERERVDDPARAEEIATILAGEFVLVLGTNFWHKNWTWFIGVMRDVANMGWNGNVVFAGPTPDNATSTSRDRAIVENWDHHRVSFLGRVSDNERLRLLAGARLVVSPSISEGWGMIPFEAVAMGSVPLATRGGGLGDITPSRALSLGLADDELDAQVVFRLLTDTAARRAQSAAWSSVDLPTWADVADLLVDHMFDVLSRPRTWRPLHAHRDQRAADRMRRIRRFVERVFPRGTMRRRVVSFLARLLRSLRRLARRLLRRPNTAR